MSEIQALKDAIAETNSSLENKVKILESNAKETAHTIKDSLEQGAAGFRKVVHAISPVHQAHEHPLIVQGAIFGLGMYLARRSARRGVSSSLSRLLVPSKAKAIIEPVAIGLFTAVMGEVIKKYAPKIEEGATAIQSALMKEMSQRVMREI